MKTVASTIGADAAPGFPPGGKSPVTEKGFVHSKRHPSTDDFSGRPEVAHHGGPGCPSLFFKPAPSYFFLTFLVVFALAAGCGQKKIGAENAASLEDLNRALSVVTMRRGSFPPSTNEVAAFLAISGQTLPVAPPGKRLVLDPDKRQYVLLDQ